MNNWLKAGVLALVAILLVISAVSITIAVTKNNAGNQVAAASYNTGVATGPRVATGPTCPSCPGYQQDNGAGSQGATTGYQSSCCGTVSQNTAPSTVRGSCCGAR